MFPKPNQMNRQNSSPHLGRSTLRNEASGSRSKTPPAKFETPKTHNPTRTNPAPPSQSFTFPRATQKKPLSSSETSSKSTSCKTATSPELSKDSLMDIKYNLYCQANLMVLHSKGIEDLSDTKMIQEMENLEMSLLEMDEKMTALDTDLEKIRFFKKVRSNLQDKIESYEKIIDTVDENKLDEYIRILEEDLGNVHLKNFSLPETEEETKEVLKCVEEINNELKQMPEIEKKISPLTQLHSSWLEVKRNVQKEEELKNICEEYLKTSEELIYDHCFKKSLEQEPR